MAQEAFDVAVERIVAYRPEAGDVIAGIKSDMRKLAASLDAHHTP